MDHVIEDRESGATLRRLDRLVEFCQTHPRPATARGLVIALDASRWGRFNRPGQSQMYIELLHRYGWDVEFARERQTGNVDADLIVGGARAIASKAERDRIRRRAHDSMLAHARQKRWQGRQPFGFTRVAVHSVTGRERRLEPYEKASADERVRLEYGAPDAVRTVQRIFARFAGGASLTAIADELNRADVLGPFDVYRNRGDITWWTPHTVRAMLLNAAYVGTHVWHRRAPAVEAPDGRKPRPRRERSDWVVVEDAHPPLVDRATWDVVEDRLAQGRALQHARSPYLLTGLMHCATCGKLVVGGGGARPKAKDPGRYRFYRCRGAVTYPPVCEHPVLTVNQRWLDAQVVALVTKVVRKAVASGALGRALDRALCSRDQGEGATRAALERERRDLGAQRDRLVEAIGRGVLSPEDAATKLAELKATMERVRAELEGGRLGQTADAGERARLLEKARDFPARLKTAPPAVARNLLASWVAGITLDKSKRAAEIAIRRVPASCAGVTSPDRPSECCALRPPPPRAPVWREPGPSLRRSPRHPGRARQTAGPRLPPRW